MAFIRPSFMDNMSWEMAEVYGAITDQILINLSRYFPYFKAGNVPKSAFEYQANMLAQMGQVNADTIRIIRNGLGGANKALSHCLEQAIIESVKKSQPDLLKAVKAGILKPAGIPIVAPTQMRAFSLYYQQAAQKLNLVNTVMLESTKQAYQATVADIANRVQVVQTALDIGAGETVTGVSTWNQALRHSINRMKENGVVGFIDHGGHRWSAEAYTAMDIRTTVANTARAAVWETNQDFGNDLYIVSYHDGARPLCYDWQNKVISSTNNARTVRDLDGNEIQVYAQSDTTYGEPAGLFGINCKHYPSPFIPGVSVLYDSSEIPSEKENEKIYEQTQQQRALERKLREEKRDLLMAKEMGADADEIKALRTKCRETSDDIDKFCEETGLPRRQNREGVFTQRSFPDKDTYDPATFERQQKDVIDKYFRNGGAQQGYTFGQTGMQENAFDSISKSSESSNNNNAPVKTDTGFVPAKTKEEAEQYALKHFANSVDYNGISVANCNIINETLTELTLDYPITELDEIKQTPSGPVGRGSAHHLFINGKKLGKTLTDTPKIFAETQKINEETIEIIRSRYKGKLPVSAEQRINELQKELKFKRYDVFTSSENPVRGLIAHEYGHILSDQYFGMINHELANPHYTTNYQLRYMYDRWQQAFDKAWDTGDIYNLSKYGSKRTTEFFAECFASRFLGEKLPDYVESLLDEVLLNGFM